MTRRGTRRGAPRRGAYGQKPAAAAIRLQTTTLWYYPSQQRYTDTPMGTPGYEGRTPAWVIWNLLTRYTREGDLVDPFCGGGTTVDVARDLKRRPLGYDLRPLRDDVHAADARTSPCRTARRTSCSWIRPTRRTSSTPTTRAASASRARSGTAATSRRCTRPSTRRFACWGTGLAVYVSDSFEKKKGFAPIGIRLGAHLLGRGLRPIDHVSVVRGNRKLEKPAFHRAAAEGTSSCAVSSTS